MPPPIDCWLEKLISIYEGQEDCTEVLNSSPSASEVTNRKYRTSERHHSLCSGD